MHMKRIVGGLATLLGSGLIFSGCITHEETVYHDVPRVKVEFQDDTAARIFYETLSKSPKHRDQQESKTEVDIPVVFSHKTRVLRGENALYNEAVAYCDTNKDGLITEQEARIFAAEWPRHR